jgi:5-formyltetrahydrofolate cyclo-ligase
MESKFDLRRRLRQQRRSLSYQWRRQAGLALAESLAHSSLFRRARHIACYLPADGEMDTGPVIRLAWDSGKRIYLPVLRPSGHLAFRAYRADISLRPNRFHIPEPTGRNSPSLPVRRLDLVLAPLVAFDRQGHRLGMGGGFYDRTFAFLHHRKIWQRPRILGVAYGFQEVEQLPTEPWDVPLWGIATERGLRRFYNDNLK